MAAPGCIFHRTLTRSRSGPHQASCPAVCRESLFVLDVHRYSRDQGSSVYFPQAVLMGDDLYDITLTDGDCRLRVTLDPGLNRLVERNVLQPGSMLRNATFTPAMAAQLPECTGVSGEKDSYRLVKVEVTDEAGGEEGGVRGINVGSDSLPWFGQTEPEGSLLPLRANRSVFLPLWNSVDYSGEEWREAPPTYEERDEEEDEEHRPSVTVSELRDAFLCGHRSVTRGTMRHQLIVRVINKSHLMYYGKPDRNCDCPYKAVLEASDQTGSVSVVMWNSVCLTWYRCLKPGDIISLRHYRVKQHYQAEIDDIEISVNSRNPAARISILPESSVSPEYVPPVPTYSFYNSEELRDHPNGDVCDVIGLLTFSGRSERIRDKDGRGAELLEYHWLRLEDGASSRPIMVKLFSTSQPESHNKLHPLSVVVCTGLKVIRAADRTEACYLTNTTYTQVYCTGLGHHSEMKYRKLRPVRQFLQWLKSQDDGQVLGRALIGGFFIYPPPPVSLETYMKERRGEPGFLRGAELQREVERLCYRERRTYCIQATVTMVTYSRIGEEDRCLFWMDRASSLSPPPPPHPPPASRGRPLTPPPPHPPPPLELTPSRLERRPRHPRVTMTPEPNNKTVILFEASMEFLENTNSDEGDEGEDEEDDTSSYVTAPLLPVFPLVAVETLPMRYDHARKEDQAGVVAMGGKATDDGGFDFALEDYYTLRLKALSDNVMVDVVFLPHSSFALSPPLHHHSNTWSSILSHGAFSSHTPPPSPADLITMATQLANQRLVCVLEACHLGGAKTELILSRAFHLTV
nr:RPA-related protein RADX-like [Labrus bergylta]